MSEHEPEVTPYGPPDDVSQPLPVPGSRESARAGGGVPPAPARRSGMAVGLTIAAVVLLLTTVGAVAAGRMIATNTSQQPSWSRIEAGQARYEPMRVPQSHAHAGDEPRAAEGVTPQLAREAIAELLATAVTAAGDGVEWQSRDGVGNWSTTPVLDAMAMGCSVDGAEGILFDLPTAAFRTGVITDTTSDEHDRAVQDGNLAAAERIADAWAALGYTRDEALGGDILLGGSTQRAVDYLEIDFTFGHGVLVGRGLCVAPDPAE